MTDANDMYSDGWSADDILREDGSGRELAGMKDNLAARRSVFKAVLDRGVTQAEFQAGEKLLASFDAASQGLEKAWKRRHKDT